MVLEKETNCMETAKKLGVKTRKVRSKFNDEFEAYLKKQCLKTHHL